MNKVKKKLAFGCMRLPMTDGRVDEPQFCRISLQTTDSSSSASRIT